MPAYWKLATEYNWEHIVQGSFLDDQHPLGPPSADGRVERCPMSQRNPRDAEDFIGGVIQNGEVFLIYFTDSSYLAVCDTNENFCLLVCEVFW